MKIHYSTKKLEKVLTSMQQIKKHYGKDFVKITNRLSELRAADNLKQIPEIPPPRRHKLFGNYAGCWGINFSKNDRIIIQPTGDYDINDLSTITEVIIVTLEDYH